MSTAWLALYTLAPKTIKRIIFTEDTFSVMPDTTFSHSLEMTGKASDVESSLLILQDAGKFTSFS